MTNEEIEAKICDLVERSLTDRSLKDEFAFEVSEKIIHVAWKYHFIDLRGYIFKIHSDEIRHIENEHQGEVYHVCKIHIYLEKFKKLDRTRTRDAHTGKKVPCLTFTKQLNDKKIKIVKLNLSREKVLSLKTLYEV